MCSELSNSQFLLNLLSKVFSGNSVSILLWIELNFVADLIFPYMKCMTRVSLSYVPISWKLTEKLWLDPLSSCSIRDCNWKQSRTLRCDFFIYIESFWNEWLIWYIWNKRVMALIFIPTRKLGSSIKNLKIKNKD